MRNRCFLLALVMLLSGFAVATTALAAGDASAQGQQEPAVSLKPIPLVHIGKSAITNSMLVTWIVAAGIIVFGQIATQNRNPNPSGIRNFCEVLVACVRNLLSS